jgi:uncharacterized protein YegP (UPF0339 family)
MATAQFELYKDAADEWWQRLKDPNGVKIASSGESFASKSNAKRAAENVKATAPGAIIAAGPDMASRAALMDALLSRGRY